MATVLSGNACTGRSFKGLPKEIVRSEVADLVRNVRPRWSLLLPNMNFTVTKQIINQEGFVIAVERDPRIYTMQEEYLQSCNSFQRDRLVHVRSNASHVIRSLPDKIGFAWLDFCGSYCREMDECITNFRGEDLIVTVLYAREKQKREEILKDRDAFYYKFFSNCNYHPYKVFKYWNKPAPLATWFLTRKYQSKCEFFLIL